jgi:hypothetical protein
MKKSIIVLTLLSLAALAFAMPPMPHHYGRPEGEYLKAELEAVLAETRGQSLGELTGERVEQLAGRLSVARQKDAYVARAQAMSFMSPGLGQFATKEYGAGALFLGADLAVAAGTLVGAYFLLPEDLQFKQLDYLNSGYATIRDRWEAHSFVDLLPTVAVLAGGGLVKGVLGGLSAKHAGKVARRNIEQGQVTFEPNLLLLPHGPMMMGMGLRY